MVVRTSSLASTNIAEVLDMASGEELVSIFPHDAKIAVVNDEAKVEDDKNCSLDVEFKLIMQRHGKTIKALADQ